MSEQSQPGPQQNRVPAWAIAPYSYFLDQARYLSEITRLSCGGLASIESSPAALEYAFHILDEVSDEMSRPNDPVENAATLEKVKADSVLARTEISAGFPLIYSNGMVFLWSLLEAMTRSTVAAWIRNNSDLLHSEVIGKLRVRW